MSDGAMMSIPARTCDTAVRASNCRLSSFTISYSAVLEGGATADAAPSDLAALGLTTPQCPCDMYSHKQTSPMTTRSGNSLLIARDACCTIPSSAQAPVATSSLLSGRPNRMMAGTPSECASRASLTASSTDRLYTPGMERTSLRTPSPGHTNMGYTSPSGDNCVSRTMDRKASVRRNRLSRVTGNAIEPPWSIQDAFYPILAEQNCALCAKIAGSPQYLRSVILVTDHCFGACYTRLSCPSPLRRTSVTMILLG